MDRISKAFEVIKRQDFLPAEEQNRAEFDMPVPIGFGQTNSQPTTVELMLEWLEPEPGNKVLDVGSGSGWTTALLAQIVGKKGFVYAVEIIPELVELGRKNCQKYHLDNVKFYQAGEKYGLPKHEPFDRILVSAAANQLPQELVKQLAPYGRLIIPVRNDIFVIDKAQDGTITSSAHPGFMFVPLIQG